MYIHKIITLLSLHLVPKISLTCFNVKIIILSDSYGTVTLPRHWMESNSKRPNWVSEQIHPELRILIFLFHTVTDMDCDQKWITHESQCKFIESKDSEDLSTVLSKLWETHSSHHGCDQAVQSYFTPGWHWSLPEALSRKGSQHLAPKTLPLLISLPSPSVPLSKTLLIMHKDYMTVFWRKSIHHQPSSSTSTPDIAELILLASSTHTSLLNKLSISSLRCHSLSFALSSVP